MKIFGNKKQTIFLFIFIAIIVAAIVIGIFFLDKSINTKKEDVYISDTDKVLIEMGIPEEEYSNMTEDEKNTIIDEEYYERTQESFIYQKGNKEYEDSEALMTLLLTYAGQFKFSSIIEKVAPLIDKYNFTTDSNREIVEIYNDAKMLTNVYALSDSGYSIVMYNMTSPLLFTGIYLSAPNDLIKQYTIMPNSQYPYYAGIIKFSKPKKYTLEGLKESLYYPLIENDLSPDATFYEINVSGTLVSKNQASVACYIQRQGEKVFKMVGCFGDSPSLIPVGNIE